MKESVGLGFLSGAGLGAGTGAMVGKAPTKGKDALIGAGIGGAVGALSGYIIHTLLEDRDKEKRKELLFNLENYGLTGGSHGSMPSDSPLLSDPSVEMITVEPRVEGNRYIESHREWIIQEPSRWSSDQKPKQKKKLEEKKSDEK